jgi:signal transduction histidine kinase
MTRPCDRYLLAALAAATAGLVVAGASRRGDHHDDQTDTLLATASHELRTPLTSLHLRLDLLAEALEEEPPDLTQAREHAQRATAQSRRLIRLTNDLLHLATAGSRPSRPVDLREIAREVIGEFEGVRAPPVELELRAEGAVYASGDPGAVAQILRILLDNALRFAPAGTVVSVSAVRRGRHCELTVSDSGRGIAEGDRERIFRRFERGAHGGHDGRFGLGLAIGRELARRLGGELRLSSAAAPTAFTLELPRWA